MILLLFCGARARAAGRVSIAFTARQPGVAFTARKPGITFTARE